MAAAPQNGPLTIKPVYSSTDTRVYTGSAGDYLDVGHTGSLALSSGTISLSFSLDRLPGDMALISKDASGRDQGGQFTVWLEDGTILAAFESATGTEYLRVPDLVLSANTTYQFAMSFGDAGLNLWLNGELVASEPEFTQGLALNDEALVIGGTRAWRSSDSDPAHSLLKGTVGDVLVFDKQIGSNDMIKLAEAVDPSLAMTAQMTAQMEDLAPVFQQVHHGSDTLKEILADYGVNEHGHMSSMLKMISRGKDDNKIIGTDGADGINGWRGDDDIRAGRGDDVVQGGYGNDKLGGGNGDDILDGGHGEDRLVGGKGDDLLISRADAREPKITYDADRDEMDPLNELTNGKLYPNQPIPGDDVLTGGKGADIFYFQTLINAKERYIEKHTGDDGVINWHGVAGENDKLHDHWVDTLGNDVVMDYNRAAGDRIVIEGHTTEIGSIRYGDANGDGVMDHSVISLYSDQGSNGGAHNDDHLGTITVYGDLVKMSDIEHTAKPAYGIITDIDDLKEALKPTDFGEDSGKIAAPKALPAQADLGLPGNLKPVMAITGNHQLDGSAGDYLDVGHTGSLALSSGTISLSFSLDRLPGDMALISKDASGRDQGGQFTVWLEDGTILAAFESATGTEYLRVPDLVLSANTTYQFAMSFGDAGLNLWLNGELVASEPEFTQGLALNDEALVIGGTRAWRSSDSDPAHSLLKGTVGDVLVFDKQIGSNDMIKLAEAVDPSLAMTAQMTAQMEDLAPVFQQVHHGSDTLKEILADYGVNEHGHMSSMLKMISRGKDDNKIIGTDGADGINGWRGDDDIRAGRGDDVVQGGYGNDKLGGGNGDDILDGGHGEDRLVGGKGDDLLISRADAREPKITYDADRDEMDPLNELTNGKLYPNQPIPGDDVLTGGKGADIFYFQTLINAKERYIEKHTGDDGVINWHGVAGENDKLHDHWVDTLGNDVVMDYNRAAGDRIVIEGHTTEIGSIRYGDANGDGVMDHSVISLYSDQGSNGGAHNDDHLGTITVYGDLVKMSDIEHTAKPAYGIITDIDDLKEALKPTDFGEDSGKIKAPNNLPGQGDLGLPANLSPVMAIAGINSFSSDERAPLVFDHTKALDLTSGTVAMTFTMDKLGDYQALFAKDANDYGDGGHITAYINPLGHLIVRMQDTTDSHYLEVKHAITAGTEYDLALSFGKGGAELYLNGARVAYDVDLKIDLSENTEALIVGASGWNSMSGMTNNTNSHFNGTISEFMVFDTQLTGDDIYGSSPREDYTYFNRSIDAYSFTKGANGAVVATKGSKSTTMKDDVEFADFSDLTVRIDDFQFGSSKDDSMYGMDGSDVLLGRGGNDTLRGYDNDDLLRGGSGDDTLSGGKGLDRLFADAGDDKVYGGDGADLIKGGDGSDVLYGEAGNDRLFGGLGDDTIYGNVWNDKGTDKKDKAYFDGELADFKFESTTWYDSYRSENVTKLVVTDSASGGKDGFYEGQDTLIDIDLLVFADQTVTFDFLI